MTYLAINPPNLGSILTSFGEYPYNLEIRTSGSNRTYTLPTNFPLTNYVMNICHTADSSTTLTINGILIPIGSMVSFVFSPEAGTWYDSTSGSDAGAITSLTGPVTATGPGAAATSITAGAIKPAAISTTNTDTFTFPHDIVVTRNIALDGGAINPSYAIQIGTATTASTEFIRFTAAAGQAKGLEFDVASTGTWVVSTTAADNFQIQGTDGATTFYAGGAAVSLPQLTTTQKNALTPSEGWMVYDTTLHAPCWYDGTTWQTTSHV